MFKIKIAHLAVSIIFLFIGLDLVNLQIIQASKFKKLSDKNCIRLMPKIGARGKILDRQGNVIVDSKLTYNVLVSVQKPSQADKLFLRLGKILEAPFKDLNTAYKSGYLGSSLPVTVARNIESKKAIALEELKPELPNVIIQPQPIRHYPYGRLGAHIIGYLSEIDRWRLTKLEDYGYKTKDVVGFGGVEEKYDYYLREEEGGSSVEVDHRGRLVRVLGFKPPANGKDIQLTLDLKIQKIIEEALVDKKGCVILMSPYTGEIFAMASSPSFNPAVFVERREYPIANLFNNPASPLINRAISAAYPAGSLFKLIVAAAALETKKINLAASFLCQGKAMVGRQEFACWDSHGAQNLIAAITHSCNVFFYKTGLLVGAQAIYNYALKFGLSRPASFELPYEISGFIPSPLWRKINKFKNWFDGDTANLSIGQGDVLVTPIQMARMMAVFANKGYLVAPYIVKTIEGKDVSAYQRKSTKVSLQEGTLNYIRQGLRNVVRDSSGTANVLSGLSVAVAGKTGTAQAPPGQPHAWFVGFFPFKNPEFVICVFLERGGPGYMSSLLAKQIVEKMIQEKLVE